MEMNGYKLQKESFYNRFYFFIPSVNLIFVETDKQTAYAKI